MTFRLLALCLLALALSGCAATITQYDGPDAGYAISAIAAGSGTEYSSYRLLSRDGKSEGEFVWLQNNMFSSDKPDFTEPGKAGEVNALRLAPGEYELYSFSVFQNGYPSTMTYTPRQEFSIPFTVRPQQAVYLGEYMAIATYGENLFGMTVKGGPIFVVTDQRARDTAIAKTEAPGISIAQSAIPTSAAVRPPLFTSVPPGL